MTEVEELTPPDRDESDFAPDAPSEDDVKYVELEKGDKGLGFSILDDQVTSPPLDIQYGLDYLNTG